MKKINYRNIKHCAKMKSSVFQRNFFLFWNKNIFFFINKKEKKFQKIAKHTNSIFKKCVNRIFYGNKSSLKFPKKNSLIRKTKFVLKQAFSKKSFE